MVHLSQFSAETITITRNYVIPATIPFVSLQCTLIKAYYYYFFYYGEAKHAMCMCIAAE